MEEALRALLPPARKALPWVLMGLVAVGLVVFGADRVGERVRSRGRFVIKPADLRLRRVQQIGDLQVEVEVSPIDLPAKVSALDRGVAGTLADGFGRHPWVEQVRSLAIRYPNRVKVSLTLRRPVVAVRVRDTYCWVDPAGVCLPGTLRRRRLDEAGLMYVEGARGPVPDAGQPWPDPGVRAGAETAAVLADDAKAFDITVVDVSNINGRQDHRLSEIVLLTARHTRILWGRPPSTERLGELPPEQKLRLLRLAAAKGLLNGRGDVDIRFPNEAIGRPPPIR